ncbi:MAG: acyl-CoA thioesterase [Chitinophagales bacterium]|nr:acyl-CoA thioesterase [Chitinophagales bacterium]
MDKHDFNLELKSYKFKQKIAMRWGDQDELQHINNAVYLTYMEEYRIRYLMNAIHWSWENDKLILARVTLDFINQLNYHDDNYIYIRCSYLGNKSFTLDYIITDEKSDIVIISKGTTVMVTFDYDSNRSIPIREDLKQRFIDYEPISPFIKQ